ncbi:hypothetical protein V1286_007044 [Bradyrhizobium algeriense]|uniref:Uncharacterized protein n=1 Tax=Bradyrhizobium algeriense TaxID=634784 RepID=A0ABU8BLT0_9BRAD
MQTSDAMRREIAKLYPTVIASEAKQSMPRHKERMDCFASLAMTRIGRSVLDTPSSRGMTASLVAATSARSAPLALRMPNQQKTTSVNTAVTSFLYPLPTISPCRGRMVSG